VKLSGIILIFVLVLGFSVPADAGSVGGPAKALGLWKSSMSFEYDGVFERDLEVTASNTGEIRSSYAYYAKGILGIHENIDVYGNLGAADLKYKWKEGNVEIEEEFAFGFYWGLGVKGVYPFLDDFTVFLDAQYSAWYTDIDNIKRNTVDGTGETGDSENTEYQISIGISRKFFYQEYLNVTPYAGVKFAQFETKNKGVAYDVGSRYIIDEDLDNDDTIGVFIGVDLQPFDYKWAVNVEGRFLDELAVTAGLRYEF